MIDLSVIIVNYNVKEFLQNLLESLKKASQGIKTEIIVIDNASDDGSVEIIREKFSFVNLIDSKVNLGFGRANNLGLQIARGKYLLLINPDTIVREDTFHKLIDFFENTPDAGLAGCKVLNPDGTLQLACRRGFPGPWTSFTKIAGLSHLFPKSKLFATYNLTYLNENETYEVDAISGSFMMLRREVYEKVGGFDPDFFMYGEDLDFCYRTKMSGFKVYYFHDTEIIHYKGESTKRSSMDETKVFYQAMHLFVQKHFSSSAIVVLLLRAAIFLRNIIAFLGVYRLVATGIIFDFVFLMISMSSADRLYLSENWSGFPEIVKPMIFIIPAAIQIIISASSGIYRKNSLSVLRNIGALFVGFVFLSSITLFLKQFAFSRAVLLIYYIAALVLLSAWRIILKLVFKIGVISDLRKTRTLVVGSAENTAALIERIRSNYLRIYNVVGLIGVSRRNIGEKVGQYNVIGSLENILKIIREFKVDKVIISAEDISYEKIFSVVSQCQGEKVEFLLAGSSNEFLVGKSSITMLDHIPLLKVDYNISSLNHRILKRSFDFLLSSVILLFVYPLLFLFLKLFSADGTALRLLRQVPMVFSGRKSFVGPEENSRVNGLYLGRNGITGLWFTENFDRSDDKETERLNLYYAKNQNIWLDIEILGNTLTKLFFKSELE